MDSKTIANGILRAAAVMIGITLLALFLYEIRSVLVYLVTAAVVSLMGRPVVIFLKKRLKFSNNLAVVITLVIMVGIIIGLFSMFIPLILQQGKNLSLLQIDPLKENISKLLSDLTEYFALHDIDIVSTLQEAKIMDSLDLSILPNFFNSFLGAIGSLSIGFFSTVFIAFFFLKDSKLIEQSLMAFIPDSKENKLKHSLETIKDLLSRYFIGLMFQILILFVIYSIVLLIFGIENSIVIAFLCALLNLIPYVGPLIGGILMVVLTMSSNLGADFSTVILPKTIYVLIGFLLGQLIDNSFTVPLVFSKSVKSHPLEIFLIIIIGGLTFGIIGMVVAVPLYTVIKVILKEFLSENKIVKSLTKNL